MTSPTLKAMVAQVVAGLFPSVPVRDREKADILGDVMAEHGWRAVLAVGAELRRMADHPVVRGVVAPPDPRAVLERWTLLERFSHSKNRVELVDASAAHLTLRHVASDGTPIAAVNDLFVWGLLISLFELAGASELRGSFGGATEGSVEGAAPCFHPPPVELAAPSDADTRGLAPSVKTHVATFHWTASASPEVLPLVGEGSLRERLHRLVRLDPLARWTLRRAAKDLGVPARTLQRGLQAEQATFTETVQRARVAVAEALLGDPRLTLTEVAFCSGFADHAHFTRTFRRYLDVPPTALRQALGHTMGPTSGRVPGDAPGQRSS